MELLHARVRCRTTVKIHKVKPREMLPWYRLMARAKKDLYMPVAVPSRTDNDVMLPFTGVAGFV